MERKKSYRAHSTSIRTQKNCRRANKCVTVKQSDPFENAFERFTWKQGCRSISFLISTERKAVALSRDLIRGVTTVTKVLARKGTA